MFKYEEIYDAYIRCRKSKRNTVNALSFEVDLIENICDLETCLNNRTYRPSRSVCFVTSSPKLREVFAADFRDRVLHHLVVPVLEEIFEPLFIHDSYSARKDKGIHRALSRAQKFSKASKYYLQLDVKNFFYSIDKKILFALLNTQIIRFYKRKCLKTSISQDEMLWLLHSIIFNDVCDNAILKDAKATNMMPSHKTLFKIDKRKGLPIGNLTSQFFANVYLNGLDNFCKRELKSKRYLRYVDDFVLFGDSKAELIDYKYNIEAYLQDVLGLSLRQSFRLRDVDMGLDFLGYVIRPFYILVRQRVVNNFKMKKATYLTGYENAQGKMSLADINAFLAKKASFHGHAMHANSFNLLAKVGGLKDSDPFLF